MLKRKTELFFHFCFYALLFTFSRRRGFGRDAILFVGPAAEVYQLAALGAERAVGVILPFGGIITGRTIHSS